jgi:hypothetical protein
LAGSTKTAGEAVYAYTPGLKIKEAVRVRKVRELPIPGDVMVDIGATVDFDTVVAQMEMPGDPHIVKANLLLRVEPQEIGRYMTKKVGDRVKEGEKIAEYVALFGLVKRFVASPVDGTIENIGASGWVTVRTSPVQVAVKAFIPGEVVEVNPGKGVTIETNATYIQGIFGVGGETHGPLSVLVDSPGQPLTADMITPEHRGRILVGGSYATLEALQRAREVGVAGVIVGGFDGDDLTRFLGYEMGVAITGEEEIGITVIITEGFGRISMSARSFELLKTHDGRSASINGETQIRAGVIRPEVIIPHEGTTAESHGEGLPSGMVLGTPVRIIREPYFGALGKVRGLPVELQATETESKMRVVEVELGDGMVVIVPRANVEIIEV